MTAATRNIAVEVGARYELRITWMVRPSEGAPLEPQDLSTASAFMQIRKKAGSPILLDLSSLALGGQDIFLSESPGLIRVVITPTQADQLAAVRRAKYDLLVELAPGFRERLMEGTVEVRPAITVPGA